MSTHWRLLLTLLMVSAPPISDHNKKRNPFMFRLSPQVRVSCYCSTLISFQCSAVHNGTFRGQINLGLIQEKGRSSLRLSEGLLLISLDLISLTAAVRWSFSAMRFLMVMSVITSLSSSCINRLLCFPSSSWLVTTSDSSWPISDSCCSFKTETKFKLSSRIFDFLTAKVAVQQVIRLICKFVCEWVSEWVSEWQS